MSAGPVRDLAFFAEALRRRGMTVTPDQVGDMARSLLLVDLAKRLQVRAALLSLSVTDPDQRQIFDEEFRRFFEMWDTPASPETRSRLAEVTAARPIFTDPGLIDEGQGVNNEIGASDLERLAHRDFADLDEADADRARRLVMTTLWEPSDFRIRRWVVAARGRRPDLRRTFRGAIGPEGAAIAPEGRTAARAR